MVYFLIAVFILYLAFSGKPISFDSATDFSEFVFSLIGLLVVILLVFVFSVMLF
tara:strand:- start:120 stop:281 length:162 start_codon:yes stop_codon:yes gene_type:complete